MRVSPQAIGIDISAERLHVATSPHPREPIHEIDLTDPNWHCQLAAIIPPGATVGYEPTGFHYSGPIVATLQHIGCHVIQVEHRATGLAREWRISGVKEDMTDAQALCYIAQQYALGTPPRGIHPITPGRSEAVTALRGLIWTHIRARRKPPAPPTAYASLPILYGLH